MLIWILVGLLAIALFCSTRKEGFAQPPGVRYIAIASTTYLQMSQLKVISGGNNVAYGKPVGVVSEVMPGMGKKAVDGTSAARAFPEIYQSNTELSAWAVDLGKEFVIDEIVYFNRSDGCSDRAREMKLYMFNAAKTQVGEDIAFTNEQEQRFVFTKPRPGGDKPTLTYSATAGITLPRNVTTSCQACTGANNYWNSATKQCSPTESPGYSRSC